MRSNMQSYAQTEYWSGDSQWHTLLTVHGLKLCDIPVTAVRHSAAMH